MKKVWLFLLGVFATLAALLGLKNGKKTVDLQRHIARSRAEDQIRARAQAETAQAQRHTAARANREPSPREVDATLAKIRGRR